MNLRFATLKAPRLRGFAGRLFALGQKPSPTLSWCLFCFPRRTDNQFQIALLPTVAAPGTAQAIAGPWTMHQSSFKFTPTQPGMGGLGVPRPQPMPTTRKRKQDEMDFRKRMGIEALADVMGMPSMRELFGLPAPKATNATSQYGNSPTNMFTASGTAASDANWARILSADSDAFSSSKSIPVRTA